MNYYGYLHHIPTLVTACGLILLLTLESWLPAASNRRRRRRHAARNLILGFLNALAQLRQNVMCAQAIAIILGSHPWIRPGFMLRK